MNKVNAIILAGGITHDKDLRAVCQHKSFLPLYGKPMVEWVAKALKGSTNVDRVVVVGPTEMTTMTIATIADVVLPEASHEVDNLLSAMGHLDDSERTLMVTSDTPLITPTAIDDLLTNAPSADVVYAIVPKEVAQEYLPERKWIFVKATEGSFTGCSAVLFTPGIFRTHADTLRKIFDARRSVSALVRIWGIAFSIKFLLGALSVKKAEETISHRLKVLARAYVSRYPELAFDVDHVSDVALAEMKLKQMYSNA